MSRAMKAKEYASTSSVWAEGPPPDPHTPDHGENWSMCGSGATRDPENPRNTEILWFWVREVEAS